MKRLLPSAIILEALKFIYFYKVVPLFLQMFQNNETLAAIVVLPSMIILIPEMLVKSCGQYGLGTWILMFISGTLFNIIILSLSSSIWDLIKMRRNSK